MIRPIKPGGRWHRILAALATAPDGLTRKALRPAADNRTESGNVNRGKTHRAVWAMADLSLVGIACGVVSITPLGRAALAEADAAQPQSREAA